MKKAHILWAFRAIFAGFQPCNFLALQTAEKSAFNVKGIFAPLPKHLILLEIRACKKAQEFSLLFSRQANCFGHSRQTSNPFEISVKPE